MAAISPSEESYFKTPVWKHAKNRITWLLVLMLSSIVTGNVITRYEAAHVFRGHNASGAVFRVL